MKKIKLKKGIATMVVALAIVAFTFLPNSANLFAFGMLERVDFIEREIVDVIVIGIGEIDFGQSICTQSPDGAGTGSTMRECSGFGTCNRWAPGRRGGEIVLIRNCR